MDDSYLVPERVTRIPFLGEISGHGVCHSLNLLQGQGPHSFPVERVSTAMIQPIGWLTSYYIQPLSHAISLD